MIAKRPVLLAMSSDSYTEAIAPMKAGTPQLLFRRRLMSIGPWPYHLHRHTSGLVDKYGTYLG
jgi:hypothetical protein